jgi:hypothetical protein
MLSNSSGLDLLRTAIHPLNQNPRSLDPLIHLAADAQFVLLGEASHGTHEFYLTRAEITKRLIREKGFHAVAVEADWPDATESINMCVRGTKTRRRFNRSPALLDSLCGCGGTKMWKRLFGGYASTTIASLPFRSASMDWTSTA